MIKIFFDASVLFAALYSVTGASHKLSQLVQQGRVKGFLSETVIEEVENHLDKFPTMSDINTFVKEHRFIVREHIQPSEVVVWQQSVDRADAHVVAGAVSFRVDYLVTLDKKHLDHPAIKKTIKDVNIVSPKECLLHCSKVQSLKV